MNIDLSEATEYRELRVFAEPDELHEAIDALLAVPDVWELKVEIYLEGNFGEEGDLIGPNVSEYAITATLGPTSSRAGIEDTNA